MATVSLENTRAGGFGLPTGQVIPGYGSIAVEPEVWGANKDHPVVKAMVDDGSLIVDGKGKKKVPTADDKRDENGETPEMAEMRKRFDASFAAVTTELQAEKGRVAELEKAVADREAEIAALKEGGSAGTDTGYTVVDKGRGWFVVTKDGAEVTKSLREDDVKGFDAMSDADKTAFVDLHKPE